MSWLTDPEIWAALFTLTALEIVLGVDNIIFISIVTGSLPEHQRSRARKVGLSLAVITRILLLSVVFALTRFTQPILTIYGNAFSLRDIVLIGGGLFLLAKSTSEIHDTVEGLDEAGHQVRRGASFFSVIVQVLILDLVFSLDSIITAIGMANDLAVMAAAIVIAIGFMMWAADPFSDFVHRHPSIKMLALSFLVVIGVALIAEGFDLHIPKGYIYFAMAYSVGVEMLNMRRRTKVGTDA